MNTELRQNIIKTYRKRAENYDLTVTCPPKTVPG